MTNKIIFYILLASIVLSVLTLIYIEYYESAIIFPVKNWNGNSLKLLKSRFGTTSFDNFSFAVLGDSREGNEIFGKILKKLQADKDVLFLLHLGDMVNSDIPDLTTDFYNTVTKYYINPVFIVPGNHDIKRWGLEFYTKMFGKRYYAFTFKNVLFICLDTSFPQSVTDTQIKWLKNIFATKLKKQKISHIFVFMHQPLYDPRGGKKQHCLPTPLSEKLMRILMPYNPDFIFASHIHGLFKGKWQGIPYVITGGAGAPLAGQTESHYFYNYIKVHVTKDKVSAEIVKYPPLSTQLKNVNKPLNKPYFPFLSSFKYNLIEKFEFALYIIITCLISLLIVFSCYIIHRKFTCYPKK